MNRKKLLYRLLEGSLQNVPFRDIIHLAAGYGFYLERIR